MVLTLYIALGAAAGLIAGLFGVGGGILIVPVLVFAFTLQGLDPAVLTHLAIGTSLACIVITSISSTYNHQKHRAVLWPIMTSLSAGLVIGVFVGANMADRLQGPTLQLMIGVFACIVALQMGLGLGPKAKGDLPSRPVLGLVGTLFGVISAMFGIGGGSLNVPFLAWRNVPMQKAVATAAACGLPIAVVGALSNIYTGWGEAGLPEYAIGYVYLPAFLGVTVSSALFARFGAKLAHRLPPLVLKRIFAGFLFLIGLNFIFRNL